MTRDEIIEAARKAGYGDAMADLHGSALERLAAIIEVHVAAREQEKFKQEREQYVLWLEEAAYDIADWGGYASEYFQEKHGLDEDVKLYRNRAAAIRARGKISSPDQGQDR